MSNTDSLSFAPDTLTRGGPKTNPNGVTKISLTTSGAADHIAVDSWGGFGSGTTVTYAFRVSGTVPDEDSSGFSLFSAVQIAAAQRALSGWSDVANIRFTRVDDGSEYSNNASILFANYDEGSAAGFAFFPGNRSAGSTDGDVWINTEEDYNRIPVVGDYGAQVLVHEIGHSIGLSHPGEYDAGDDVDPTYENSAEYYEDSRQYTVMTYFASTNSGASLGAFSAAPLLDDITSAQRLYGANMTTRTGDTVYGFHSTAGQDWYAATSSSTDLVFCAWDAGGNDTFDFSGYSQNQRIDLRAGNFSDVGGWRFNVSVAYNVTIENGIGGSGNDTIVGNAAANILDGGSGNDTLYGEVGNDTLRGRAGNDQIDGGSGTNSIDGGDGSDTLILPGTIGDYRSSVVASGYLISGNGVADMIANIEFVSTRSVGASTENANYTLANFVAQTQRSTIALTVDGDLTGDGFADIMWRNANGGTTFWTGGASALQGSAFGASVDSGWKILDTFDMTGDGKEDLLWRNVNGTVIIWTANGAGFTSNTYVNNSIGNDWQIVATGDFDGDQKDDLLWRYQDGSIQTWRSTGTGFATNAYSHASVGTSWKVDGVADFNGDGKDDILWKNDNGTIETWLSVGNGFQQAAYQNATVAPAWHIAGLSDFNGDGRSDILWRHDNGTIVVWSSNGNGFATNTYVNGSVGNDWHVVGAADYTGDGKSDILWRHDSGGVQVWASNGAGFTVNVLSGFADNGWSVAGHIFPL